ncbi:DEAD/DEAH box helicase [Halomicronema hongdechloris]|nr:DEAD/DEAH box helicase [Halomicronema hongdechloris]
MSRPVKRQALEVDTLDTLFQDLTSFTARNFQRETIEAILQGALEGSFRGTLLRAPTGSGKTETAVSPYLFARTLSIEFPKKLIYVVPLRTLANSLRVRTQGLVNDWAKKHLLNRPLAVTLQTGENPEDPRFEGDIIFCTIDQMLSSFLNIPYSVGRGSANVNAGAIFSSYLVFDELHLLDPERSFATLLKVLEQVNGISPFLLMTATLTDELAGEIQKVVSQ